MRGTLFVGIALMVACSSNSGDKGPKADTGQKTVVPDKAPDEPTTNEPTTKGPTTKKPTCADDMELQSSAARFHCAEDGDCRNSCKFGAINRTWLGVLGSACKDGCEGENSGPPRCVDKKCVAFTYDGKPADSCTNLPAPESTQCVPSPR